MAQYPYYDEYDHDPEVEQQTKEEPDVTRTIIAYEPGQGGRELFPIQQLLLKPKQLIISPWYNINGELENQICDIELCYDTGYAQATMVLEGVRLSNISPTGLADYTYESVRTWAWAAHKD